MDNQEMQIVMLSNIADRKRKEGDQKTAGEYFGAAMLLLEKYGATPANEAALLSNYGIYLQSQGKADKAIAMQRRALELDKLDDVPANLAFSHHNLGSALVIAEQYSEAIKHLEIARHYRESLPDYNELISTFEILCSAYFDSAQYEKVRISAAKARAIMSFVDNQYSYRGIAMTMSKLEAKEGNWDAASQYATEAIAYIEERRAEHHNLNLDLYDSRYNKHYLSAIELFLEAEDYISALTLVDRTRFRSGCDALDQGYSFGSRESLGKLILPNVQDDELFLVEWIYPKHDWSFPISSGMTDITANKISTSSHESKPTSYDLNTEWHKHAENSLTQTQHVIDFYSNELTHANKITFVPHGTQWQTPMAALRHPETKEYLCQTHPLLLSPSMRYCRITDTRPRLQHNNYLVIGDPNDNLRGARLEAEEVAAKFNCKPYLGAHAKKETILRDLAENHYDVVHFACHGSYSSSGLHGIMLADGYITDDEIISNGISANVVNLTACWSGFTDFSIWNELGGFIRALLISGVRNVVASAYPLGDKVGPVFSENFYSSYIDGAHPVESTRVALCNVANQFPVRNWYGLYITGQR